MTSSQFPAAQLPAARLAVAQRRTTRPVVIRQGFFAEAGLPELSAPRGGGRPAAPSARRDSSGSRQLYVLLGWLTIGFAALAFDRATGRGSLAFFDSIFRVQRSASVDLSLVGLGLMLAAAAVSLLWAGRSTRLEA